MTDLNETAPMRLFFILSADTNDGITCIWCRAYSKEEAIVELSKDWDNVTEQSVAELTENDEHRSAISMTGFIALPVVGTVKHVKRGSTYRVISSSARVQTDTPLNDMSEVVVYRGIDGKMWIRPVHEMVDGRFEAINVSEEE